MNSDGIVLRESVVSKVFEIAEQCVDESKKGWRVKMSVFWEAMDAFDFSGREVREALAILAAKMYVIVFPDEDGEVARLSLLPQEFRCWHCNGLLDIQDDIRRHFDDCRKRQAKIQRNRKLL
ncbi:MAG: hypothetical protein WBP71_11770 [Terracidiphilus sp.]